MSATDDDVSDAIAAILQSFFLPEGYYLQASCIALVVYEYFLTLGMERKVIWGRKFTIPTVLFLLNRYTLLIYVVTLSLWAFVPWVSDTYSCVAPAALQALSQAMLMGFYAAFSALRIHAINDHNWFWTVLIMLLGSVSVPTNFIGVFWSHRTTTMFRPWAGCAYTSHETDGINDGVWEHRAHLRTFSARIAAQICVVVMDILVLGITWYRTLGAVLAARKLRMKTSFVGLMLRDGTTFFSLSLGIHTFTIIIDKTRNILLLLVSCTFMSIIVSRFILNLRMLDSSEHESVSYSVHLTRSGSLRFSPGSPTILGNIGAPLDVDEDRSHVDYALGHDEMDSVGGEETITRGELGETSEYHRVALGRTTPEALGS